MPLVSMYYVQRAMMPVRGWGMAKYDRRRLVERGGATKMMPRWRVRSEEAGGDKGNISWMQALVMVGWP